MKINAQSRLLCACVAMAVCSWGTTVHGHTKSELSKLVKSYRSKVTDIDVSWTYLHETLAEDPEGRPRRSIPKMTQRIRQRGAMFLKDSLSWRAGSKDPIHFLTAYDGEKLITCDVDRKSVTITPGDARTPSGNWIYQTLKWPQKPPRSPFDDLAKLIESERTTVLPDRETIYGVETVVLDWAGWEKIWLDIVHGGIIRKTETRQSVGGPLLRRTEIPKLHDINGVFLPAQIVKTGFASAKNPKKLWNTPVRRSTITIPKETLKINTGLTKDAFAFEFPPGSHVHDDVTGTNYIVGPVTDRRTNDEDKPSTGDAPS